MGSPAALIYRRAVVGPPFVLPDLVGLEVWRAIAEQPPCWDLVPGFSPTSGRRRRLCPYPAGSPPAAFANLGPPTGRSLPGDSEPAAPADLPPGAALPPFDPC